MAGISGVLLTAAGVCTRVFAERHTVWWTCSPTVKERKCTLIGLEVGGGAAHLYLRVDVTSLERDTIDPVHAVYLLSYGKRMDHDWTD